MLASTSCSALCKTSGQEEKQNPKPCKTEPLSPKPTKGGWKSSSEVTAAGDPRLASRITWAGATSHLLLLLSTLTLHLLELFWRCRRFCCVFISSHCHHTLRHQSLSLLSQQSKGGKLSTGTTSKQLQAAECSQLALFPLMCVVLPRLAGGFLHHHHHHTTQTKRQPPASTPTVRTSLVVLQLACSTSSLLLSLLSHTWCSSPQLTGGTATPEAQANGEGDTRSCCLASRRSSPLFSSCCSHSWA